MRRRFPTNGVHGFNSRRRAGCFMMWWGCTCEVRPANGRWSSISPPNISTCFASLGSPTCGVMTSNIRTNHEGGAEYRFEDLIDALDLPDPGDRHVLAAAIHGRADVIVTYNLPHFPPEHLSPYGIEAQHPDEFLTHLIDLAPAPVCAAARTHRLRLKKPPKTVTEYLE